MANAMINPGLFTRRAYEIVAPAIAEAKENPDEGKENTPGAREIHRCLRLVAMGR